MYPGRRDRYGGGGANFLERYAKTQFLNYLFFSFNMCLLVDVLNVKLEP